MNPTAQAALITAIASIIAVSVGYLTQRANQQAQAKVADRTSRADVEKEAYERAESYYQGVIEDLDRRRQLDAQEFAARLAEAQRDAAGAREESGAAKTEAHEANKTAENCQIEVQQLKKQVAHYRAIGRRLAKTILAHPGRTNDPEVQEAVLAFVADEDTGPATSTGPPR